MQEEARKIREIIEEKAVNKISMDRDEATDVDPALISAINESQSTMTESMNKDIEPQDFLIQTLNEKIKQSAETQPAWKIGVPTRVAAWDISKNRWTNTNLVGDEEFVISEIRKGKRAEILIKLTPLDSRPYSFIEVPDSEGSSGTEPIQAYLAGLLGYPTKRFDAAKSAFKSQLRRNAAKAEAEAAKEKKQAEEQVYSNMDDWGAF